MSQSNTPDVNKDGIVDVNDFVVLNTEYGKEAIHYTNAEGEPVVYYRPSDINMDGITDIKDFLLLNSSYGSLFKENMVRYTIPQGSHYHTSGVNWLEGYSTLGVAVLFDETCIYDLQSVDQYDINKLFGHKPGYFHHRNSGRIGWRWSIQEQAIELLLYCYINGRRINEWDIIGGTSLGFYDIGERINITLEHIPDVIENPEETWEDRISPSSDIDLSNAYGVYRATIEGQEILALPAVNNDTGPSGMLWPYFGGNRTAPHNIDIYIEWKNRTI